MKKEGKTKPPVIQPSDIMLRNISQKNKISRRQRIRKEFLALQKEKYKNKADKQDLNQHKKKIVSQLKEVHTNAG